MQTLLQLLPIIERGAAVTMFDLPFVVIDDYPRFKYRGMHLDVCRHFFPVSFVKKYIDYLAMHKMNFFHWHLTDDQGWRIEIRKYPNLTSTGGYRNGTIIGRYPGIANDNTPYGGFYTQEEVKDVIRYAADRQITIIPEIEMPGHASAAIAAYPFLSCFPSEQTKIPSHPSTKSIQEQASGRVKLVQETWGVFEDVFCAGKDSTFTLLEGVMDEVMALFPSPYMHVGGDESPKANWKRCPNCQARIKSLNLKDEHELQSYFIQRMEKYLNAKGKTLIGWDEILEGGLAPNAWVMSWRGEKGGIEAARQNHNVIMTPGEYVYLDHTQTKNEDSVVIGGYTPIEEVYNYEPIPKILDSTKAKYIVGAQGNVWAEYMRYPSKVEYMIFPRLSALSEVLWSPAQARNFKNFEPRLLNQFRRYDLWRTNYSKAYFDMKVSLSPAPGNKGLLLTAIPRDKKGKIYVAQSGSKNVSYTKPQVLSGSQNILVSYRRDTTLVNAVPLSIVFNKATGKKATITKAANEKYAGQGGAFSLVNGIWSAKGLSYPDWLGWIGDDMDATIDLGAITSFDSVCVHTLDQNGSWVYLPQYVEVSISSDGKNFKPVGQSNAFVREVGTMGWITVSVPNQKARYIKVFMKNYGSIPEGKPGGGNKAWLFADEVQVW
jgi:hexosaminidase